MDPTQRPGTDEYAPFYETYTSKVPAGDILVTLRTQAEETTRSLSAIPAERGSFRYAPGKWSLTEVVGHLADVERLFLARAIAFARGERQPLPGFDENDYVAGARFDDVGLTRMIADLAAARRSTLSAFDTFTEDAWTRSGTANGQRMSVRAVAWVLAGHVRHHMLVVDERYREVTHG